MSRNKITKLLKHLTSNDIIMVRWTDACGMAKWEKKDVAYTPIMITTVGYFHCYEKCKKYRDYINIVSSHDQNGNRANHTVIPVGMIRDIKYLKPERKKNDRE